MAEGVEYSYQRESARTTLTLRLREDEEVASSTELTERITATGLHIDIPLDLVEALGWREGQTVTLRRHGDLLAIVPETTPEQRLQSRALAYLEEHVGDATAVGRPQRSGTGWKLPVFLSYEERLLGHLVLSDEGDVMLNESTPPETMRAAADAP